MRRVISVERLLTFDDLEKYRSPSESELEAQAIALEQIADGLVSLHEGRSDTPVGIALEALLPSRSISTEAPAALIAAMVAAVVAAIAWVLRKFFGSGSEGSIDKSKDELKKSAEPALEVADSLKSDSQFISYTPAESEISTEDATTLSPRDIKLRLVKEMHESKLLHTFDMFESPVKAADALRKLAEQVSDYVGAIYRMTSKLKTYKHREGGLPPQKYAREIADTIDLGSRPLFDFYNHILDDNSVPAEITAKALSEKMKAAASEALKPRQINVSTISSHVNTYIKELHHIVDALSGALEALSDLKGPIKSIGDVLSSINVKDRIDHPEIIAMASAIKYGFHTCQFSMSHIEQRVQEMIRLNKLISKYLK